MKVCVCRGSAACRGASCPCECHGGSVALRVPLAELPDGYYVARLSHHEGPALVSLDPVTYDARRTPIRFSRGALLAWLAETDSLAVVVERVL